MSETRPTRVMYCEHQGQDPQVMVFKKVAVTHATHILPDYPVVNLVTTWECPACHRRVKTLRAWNAATEAWQ
jgi:hypothetical protein